MVKMGRLEVSRIDSPRLGEHRDPDAPKTKTPSGTGQTAKVKRSHGSQSQSRGQSRSEAGGSEQDCPVIDGGPSGRRY
jgi:hypothetical protein